MKDNNSIEATERMTGQSPVRDETHLVILDEWAPSPEEVKNWQRLRMRSTFASGLGGWAIGEEFDDRYDTEVGGNQLLVTQSINDLGEIEGGLPASMSMDEFAAIPKQPRPPQIVDYQEGKYYSLEEAEAIPELSPVVERLKARIAQYETMKTS